MATTTICVPAQAGEADRAALLREPALTLRQGGLVAFPTETVYGLGADALNDQAVARIYRAKMRPPDNPLIIHLPDPTWLDRVAADVTPAARGLALAYWPGPLTIVLSAAASVPSVTLGGLSTVAVRIPAHPIARALISAAATPVAGPSANLSGRPSPTIADHVLADLDGRIDWIIDGGPCAHGIESTVVDARGAEPRILREGVITREMLGLDLDGTVAGPTTRSPGTGHPHYRPDARVVVAPMGGGADVARQLSDRQVVGFVGPDHDLGDTDVQVLAQPLGAEELGAVLYGALRRADSLGVEVVVIEAVPADGVGRAVMDRLRRAAGMSGSQTVANLT